MYSAALLDHFEHPRNAGELPSANARARVENPVCADTLELALSIAGDRIEDARFLCKGCVPSIACASLLTTLLIGIRFPDAGAIDATQLIAQLEIPPASHHAAHLAVEALRQALRSVKAAHV